MFAVLVGIWLTSSVWYFTSRPPPADDLALLMFKRIVNVVEVLALVGAAVFLVLLFANEPDSGGGGGGRTRHRRARSSRRTARAVTAATAAAASVRNSPTARSRPTFPEAADEIDVVTDGRGSMPSFGNGSSAKRSNWSSSTRGRCEERNPAAWMAALIVVIVVVA